MSIESVPYPTREISNNIPLFLSDIGAVAVPVRVTGIQTIIVQKGTTYITYGAGTITFTDPNILTSVSGDYYKVIVGGASVAVIGGVTYNKVSPVEIIRLVSAGAWITHSGLDASQIISGAIDAARLPSYVTLNGSEVLTNKTLTNPTINNYTEGVVAIGNSGTTKTIALTSGTFQTVTLTGSCTFTMPTPTAGKSFILKVITGTGGFTATFTGVKWSDNVAPVITAAANHYDLLSFIADGTAWSGSAIQSFTTYNPII